MKNYRRFEILLVTMVMGISLYAALSDSQNLSWRWFTRDDAYYYFKVAQNISEGHGSTFDGMNLTNGYHPLWMLVCIPIFALARFDLILPLRVLLLVMGALSAGTAILFFRLLGKIFHPAVGAMVALYWAFNYDILVRIYQQGLETGIAVFFVTLLVYKSFEFEMVWRKNPVTNRQLLILGLVALLVVLSRLDLIFLAGMVGLWIIFRASPLRYFLPLDIASILVSVLAAFTLRLSFPDYYQSTTVALTMAAISLAIKLPLAYFLGLYQPEILASAAKLVARLSMWLVLGSALTGLLMIGLVQLQFINGFPRITIAYDLLLTILFFGLSRFAVLGLRTSRQTTDESTTPWEYLRINVRAWLTEAALYFGVVGGGLAIYMIGNKLLLGTFSPISGQIKRWWGTLPGRVYGGPVSNSLSFFGISYHGDSNAWYPVSTLFGDWAVKIHQNGISETMRYLILLGLFALLYYVVLFLNKPKARSAIAQLSTIPLFTSSWVQVLSYHAPGYSAYKEWYWITQLVVIMLAVGMLAGMIFHDLRALRKHPATDRVLWGMTAVLGLAMLLPFWLHIRSNMTYHEWKPTDPDNDIAAFLEANTPPGSIIGMTGGGNAGYFIHDRTVINMDGLINSTEYFERLKERTAGKFLAAEGMGYILANPGILNQQPYKGQFTPYLEITDATYGGKDLLRYRVP